MAGLALDPQGSGVPMRAQFIAVAWLRWRLFANSFRRKGSTSDLLARLLMLPVLALLVVGPIAGGSLAAYYAVVQGHAQLLGIVFWAIFALQIIVSINIAQPGLAFDPEQLIRFPLSFPRYLTIRLALGLFSASTVIGTLALLAAAAGATVARHSLGPVVFAAALALALANMLFVRMIFAWVDRWLSTRRARELFTGLVILVSIGIQYLNVTFNPGFSGGSATGRALKLAAVQHLYHQGSPLLRVLPPGFAAASVVAQGSGHPLAAVSNILGVLAFAALFLLVFAWRMQREFGGENLSETTARMAAPAAVLPRVATASGTAAHASGASSADFSSTAALSPTAVSASSQIAPLAPARSRFGIPPTISSCLVKEWIYLRRNTSQLYAVLGPLAMVLLFSSRLGRFSHTGYTFPAAVAYSVLGVSALSYNIFGLDATGVQFYFLAPVSFRSIVLAKNLFGFLFLALDVIVIYLVIGLTAARPSAFIISLTLAWTALAAFINAAVGNIRSITAPKKMDPGKISRRQASQMSALLAVGLMLLTAALGVGLVFLGRFLALPWLPLPLMIGLAATALGFYLYGLAGIGRFAVGHRETMLLELTKAA